MGAVYLATLILGLGVLLLQFVMPAADADSSHAPELGGHGDLDHHVAGGDHAAHHHEGGGGASAIAIFLSFRFWTFGLMSFGFVGTLLHFLGLASSVMTIAVASAVGVVSGLLASIAMRAIAQSQTSSGGEADEAIGQIGRVLIELEPGKRGKIRIETRGRLVDLIATTDEARIEAGENVLVEEIRGTTAHVSRASDSIVPKP